MLKVYGDPHSSNTQKVIFTLLFLAKDYEYITIDLSVPRSPEYLKLQPSGKVPCIDDNGFVLFESDAICAYFAEGSSLYPSEIKERAIVNQWVVFVTVHIADVLSKISYAKRLTGPKRGQPVDETALAEGMKELDRFLPVIDAQLGKQAFLAGNKISLADIDLLAAMGVAKRVGIDLTPYKHILSWMPKLTEMDFYKKALEPIKVAVRT